MKAVLLREEMLLRRVRVLPKRAESMEGVLVMTPQPLLRLQRVVVLNLECKQVARMDSSGGIPVGLHVTVILVNHLFLWGPIVGNAGPPQNRIVMEV